MNDKTLAAWQAFKEAFTEQFIATQDYADQDELDAFFVNREREYNNIMVDGGY